MGYCDNLSIEGDQNRQNVHQEGHVEYRCGLTKNLCVASGFVVLGGSGITDFIEYSNSIAERCPLYELNGKTGIEIFQEKEEEKKRELRTRISLLQAELSEANI
jgi:hypothetical protein